MPPKAGAKYIKLKPSIASIARAMGVSRQRAWGLVRKQAGLCTICGKPREDRADRCEPCYQKWLNHQRKRTGSKAWKPGGLGRPPSRGTEATS